MARRLGLNEVLASYEGTAMQLGSTLVLQEQNEAELKANAQERRRDMRRWRTEKSRREHLFFFNGTRLRRQQIIDEGMKLESLAGNLRTEIRETRRKLQELIVSVSTLRPRSVH